MRADTAQSDTVDRLHEKVMNAQRRLFEARLEERGLSARSHIGAANVARLIGCSESTAYGWMFRGVEPRPRWHAALERELGITAADLGRVRRGEEPAPEPASLPVPPEELTEQLLQQMSAIQEEARATSRAMQQVAELLSRLLGQNGPQGPH